MKPEQSKPFPELPSNEQTDFFDVLDRSSSNSNLESKPSPSPEISTLESELNRLDRLLFEGGCAQCELKVPCPGHLDEHQRYFEIEKDLERLRASLN